MIAKSVWVAGALALLLVGSSATAQTVYTWKDANGVVHFSDENPEGVKNVEKLTLEAPVPLISESGAETEGGEGGGTGEAAVTPVAGQQAGATPAGPPPTGPSEVVFMGADLATIGTTQRHVRGKLRNVGAEVARRVAVRVVVTDADTGNLCTTGDIGAQPGDLGPGENGFFEGDIDSPCFFGNPKIGYYPEWD